MENKRSDISVKPSVPSKPRYLTKRLIFEFAFLCVFIDYPTLDAQIST